MAAHNLKLALRIRADLGEVKRELRGLRGAVDTSTERMARMRRGADGLTNGLTRAAVAFASFAAGARAARNIAQFEASLSKTVGLVGLSCTEVEAMGDALLALAPKVAAGPGELAEALFFVTSAGARGAEALGIVETAAQAAAAGLGDTRTVADAVTSAINAYGAANLDAGRATGILVAAVREGKAGAETIAPALGKLLPIASELGVGFDEVAGSVAFFTRSGLNAAEAATALRGLLVQILRPAEAASKAAGELGLDFAVLRKTLRERGLLAALGALDSAVGDNREAFARLFPDVEGLTALLSLLGKDADTARAILESLADAGAHTVEAAFGAGAQDTLRRYETALATLDAAAIRLGADALPVLAGALESATEHLGLLSGAAAFFLTLRFAPAVAAAAGGLQAMVVAARTGTGAMLAFNAAIRANPVGLVATGIALATAALVDYATAAEGAATPAQDAYNRALEAGRERLREEKAAVEESAEAHQAAAAAIEQETQARLVNERVQVLRTLQTHRALLAQRTAALRGAGYTGDALDIALGTDPAAASSRAAVDELADRLALLDAAIEAARERLNTLHATLDADDDEGGGDGGGKALTKASTAARELERIHARTEDAIARLTLDRFALIERETAAHIAKLEALKGAEGVNEARRLAEIEAARELGRAREEALVHEQIERDAAVARARAERMTAGYLAAVAEIERAGESLASPFSRAIAEANRWRDNVLTRLAEVAGGQADYVERVVEVNEIAAARIEAAWAEEAEHRLWASRHWEDGVTRALRDIADEAGDSAFAMESVTRDAVEGMTDALAEFVTTGKLDFSGLVNHIITELARIAIRKHIIEPLAEGLEGLFKTDSTPPNRNPIAGGIGLPPGGTAGLLHTGGIAGQLRPGEVPIIVEKGEEVLSESNPRHIRNLGAQPPAVYINFVNQGTGQREMGREVRFDPRGLFITLMTEDVAEGGPMSRGLERAYGLQRRGA